MILDTEKLPYNVQELKSMIIDLEERYLSRIEFLEERVRLLTKELFGRKSEKRPIESELRQLHLFNEAEVFAKEEEAKPIEVPAHTRQRPKRKPLPADLPRVDEIHDIAEEKKVCGCGAPLKCIGQEVSEKLDYVPAKVRVIRQIRLKYAAKGWRARSRRCGLLRSPRSSSPKGLPHPD